MTFTLDVAFAGSTTFTLSVIHEPAWPSWYTGSVNYGQPDINGINVAFFSNCFTDGTNHYIWVYDGQPVLFKFSASSCPPGSFFGYELVPQTGMSGYQCTPSFSATYHVTSGQAALYAGGVGTVQAQNANGDPLCCMFSTFAEGCESVQIEAFVTVKWWTNSGMTTLISSGPGGGEPVGAAGTLYRQIISPQFTTAAGNKVVICGDNDGTTLSVASGYHCLPGSGCGFPLPGTLHCTFGSAGAQIFTYAAGAWTASFTYLGIAYVISFDENMVVTAATAGGVDFSSDVVLWLNDCPVDPGYSGSFFMSGLGLPLGDGTITE